MGVLTEHVIEALRVKQGNVVVVRGNFDEDTTRHLVNDFREAGIDAFIVFLAPGQSLAALDEDEMYQQGWQRVR